MYLKKGNNYNFISTINYPYKFLPFVLINKERLNL